MMRAITLIASEIPKFPVCLHQDVASSVSTPYRVDMVEQPEGLKLSQAQPSTVFQ